MIRSCMIGEVECYNSNVKGRGQFVESVGMRGQISHPHRCVNRLTGSTVIDP